MTVSNHVHSCPVQSCRWPTWLMLILASWAVLTLSCKKQGRDEADDTADAPATSTSPADAGTAQSQRMDAQDDPQAPRALPRSGEAQGWIKTEAVHVAPAAQMAELVPDARIARVLNAYHMERASACTYTSPNATAHVLMVEAKSPEDAFGVFSMLSLHPGCMLREDNSLRSIEQSGKTLVLTAWQGKTWTRFDCTLESVEAGTKDCQRLADRTIFYLMAAEPPLLMQAVRDVKTQQCDLWLVRSAALLTRLDEPVLKRIDASTTNDRLGLHGEATLSVVAVTQNAESSTLVIWLAEYPSTDEAKAAADRYAKALQTPANDLDRKTQLGPVKGRVVFGTWTADQESARMLLKGLGQALPE